MSTSNSISAKALAQTFDPQSRPYRSDLATGMCGIGTSEITGYAGEFPKRRNRGNKFEEQGLRDAKQGKNSGTSKEAMKEIGAFEPKRLGHLVEQAMIDAPLIWLRVHFEAGGAPGATRGFGGRK
jgi:hypothetical protein